MRIVLDNERGESRLKDEVLRGLALAVGDKYGLSEEERLFLAAAAGRDRERRTAKCAIL